MTEPTPRRPWEIAVLTLATGLGVGLAPVAPGTVGSLWGPLLAYGMQRAGLSPLAWAAVTVVFALLGVAICEAAVRILREKDPPSVVIDEIAAFPIIFAIVDVTLATAVLGFALFRLFDISKPWPCRRLEDLPGGWGVMLDDLMAGVYAGAVLWAVVEWIAPQSWTVVG